MAISDMKFQIKYKIFSDQLGVMTVGCFIKGFDDEWVLCGIVSGDSYDMLHKLENLN